MLPGLCFNQHKGNECNCLQTAYVKFIVFHVFYYYLAMKA